MIQKNQQKNWYRNTKLTLGRKQAIINGRYFY